MKNSCNQKINQNFQFLQKIFLIIYSSTQNFDLKFFQIILIRIIFQIKGIFLNQFIFLLIFFNFLAY
jgi:hypothetical protein